MTGIRLLRNGQWSKPPVLTAARSIIIAGLAQVYGGQPLGNTASFLNGTSYDVDRVSESGEFPIIRISNISDQDAPYIWTTEALDEKYWITRGDLLVSWSASFKSIEWSGIEGFLNQHIFKVVERAGFHRGYIRHAIEASFDDMQRNVVGIGMMHLRRADFLGHLIPAPVYSEQVATASYLDWIERGQHGTEPDLPDHLAEQRSVVARIRELADGVDEARTLRRQTCADVYTFVTSVHTQLAGPRVKRLGEILRLEEITIPVSPARSYPQVGMRSFGGGLFAKVPVSGADTTYRIYNELYEGALVLSQVKGWEGAVAVCPSELAGWFVSPEYRTFRCVPTEARSGYLATIVQTEWFWSRLVGATRGVGARRERTRPEQFLTIALPMPDVQQQKRGESLFAEVAALKRLQSETAAELEALLPAILDRAVRGRL